MDPVLHFSVQSFKLYRVRHPSHPPFPSLDQQLTRLPSSLASQDQNLSPCFLLLHLLFHSVVRPFSPFTFARRREADCLVIARVRSPSSIAHHFFRTSRTEARFSLTPTSRSRGVRREVSRVSSAFPPLPLNSSSRFSLFQILALANMLSYADLAGPVAILANPFADQVRRASPPPLPAPPLCSCLADLP